MDELYDMLQDARTDRDVAKTEDYASFAKQYAAFFPLLLKVENKLFLKGGALANDNVNTINNEHRPRIRKELEYCALPFYSDPTIMRGVIEARRIVSWAYGIQDEMAWTIFYHSKYDEEDPTPPPTRTFYKTYKCWLASRMPSAKESKRDLKSFGFKMNDEELLDMLDLSELPTEPIFVYVQMEDLKKLGVEPPPMPDQDGDERIKSDAYGRR